VLEEPVTVAVNCCVAPAWTVAEVGEMVTATAGAVPVPVRGTDWLPPEALSEIVMLAERLPAAEGVNVTIMLQVAPDGTLVNPQVLLWAKSALLVPPTVTPFTVSGALPEFVTVTVWDGLVVPTSCPVKVKVVGESVTAGAEPVPVRLTDCGLPEALSVIVKLAERLPAAVGVNVTLIVQVAPAATLEVVQVLVWAKSGPLEPVMATPVMVSAALPLFVTVIPWLVLVVPTSWPVKLRLGPESVTLGAGVGGAERHHPQKKWEGIPKKTALRQALPLSGASLSPPLIVRPRRVELSLPDHTNRLNEFCVWQITCLNGPNSLMPPPNLSRRMYEPDVNQAKQWAIRVRSLMSWWNRE
jgi:hypothetical protein